MEGFTLDEDKAMVKAALSATEDCPPLEELARLLQDSARETRAAAVSHFETCVHCQTELEFAADFAAGCAHPDEAAVVDWMTSHLSKRLVKLDQSPAHSGERDVPWWGFLLGTRFAGFASLAVASALVLISVGLFVRRPGEPALQPNLYSPDVERSQSIVALDPIGELQQGPLALRWRPFPGAAAYHVRLLEVDRTELWKTDTAGGEAQIPGNVRAKLLPGKTLLWDVTALGPSGRELASSGSQRFVLKPNRK